MYKETLKSSCPTKKEITKTIKYPGYFILSTHIVFQVP